MYHNDEIPDSCASLWKSCQSLTAELLINCPVKTSGLIITTSNPIAPQSQSIYLLKDGVISERYNDQLIVNYEPGDLIGLEGLFDNRTSTYSNDFAVTVDEYDGQAVIDVIYEDKERFIKLNQYLSFLTQSFQILMCHFGQQEASFIPEFRHYNQGETIIEENTDGDEVYTLMSGTTQVSINGTEVGTVKKDEIFGAIAALTNTTRTASVTAKTNCEVIVVKSEGFKELLSARPITVHALINDMARTIVSCNEKIMALSKKR